MEEEKQIMPTGDDYEYKELYEFQTRTLDECRKFIAQNYLSDRDVQLLKCFNADDLWRVEEWRRQGARHDRLEGLNPASTSKNTPIR